MYIINALHTGGAEVGMCRLLNGLSEDKYEITVVTLIGYEESFVRQRIPEATILDCKQIRSLDDISRLVSTVANANVIIGSLYHSVLVARLAGIVNRQATVATWQHNERFKTPLRKRIVGTTSLLSDVALADSEPVAEMLREELDLPPETVKTLPIAGISLSEFQARTHHNSDDIVVGSVGVLSEQKNYATLLTVADELADEDITFRIAGDGPKRGELERQIESLGIDNVELLGRVDDLPEFLQSVDVYVQPSHYEGLCITVVEAMAAGLPVVASAVGGINYTVTERKNGFLHDPTDIAGFCDSIRELAEDPPKRERFGKRGRAIVENRYTQDVFVERFERAIHEGVV
ncbi:glycosyltransferase family 4 protein [Halostagnicola bangensis]